MPGYTSFSEMQRAKKLHGCDMSVPRKSESMSPRSTVTSNGGNYSARRSHLEFEHDKVRHQAEMLNSPPRDRTEPPKRTVYGHTHDELSARGPPFHKSCREFGHEKDQHLTPILPDRAGAPSGHGGCAHGGHVDGQCTSNDRFSEVKRKHKHELDSCSPRRSARDYEASPARSERSVASNKCTSQERFRADKAMHRHAMDECQDKSHAHLHDDHGHDHSGKSPRCTSAEQFRSEKQRHRHGIDECQDKPPAPEPSHECEGPCKSVERFTRNKHGHRHGMDECHPKAEVAKEVVDEHGPCTSYTQLSKLKKNHDHALDSCSPERSARAAGEGDEPPKHDKSNIALSNAKRSHAKDMSIRRAAATSPSHCISNEVYSEDKRKHKHLVDECRDGEGGHSHGAGGCGHGHGHGGEGGSHCTSLAKLDTDKRRHSHLIDSCRSVERERELSARREREAAEGKDSPRCKSNVAFSAEKRGHRHLLDGCSPRREHSHDHHGHDHSHDQPSVCTSHHAFAHEKRVNRIGMDDCRTPRRELFETAPVPDAAATPQTPPEA